MKKLSIGICAITATLMSAQPLQADDTEVYVSGGNVIASSRPQVLIILDNSGSMANNSLDVPIAYDPDEDYLTSSGYGAYSNYLFFIPSGTDPLISNAADALTKKRINKTYNGCVESDEALNTLGKFTTKFMFAYEPDSSSNLDWSGLDQAGGHWKNGETIVECYADLLAATPEASSAGSDVPSGFPRNGESNGYDGSTASMSQAELETARDASAQDVNFISEAAYTIYTANYLGWYLQTSGGTSTVSKTRMQVAQQTIDNLLSTTSGVDFGLAVFNRNNSSDANGHELGNSGGRIISGISEMTDQNRTDYIETVYDLNGQGNTPLCETMFDAYRYFTGGELYSDGYSETPNVDSSILNNGSYISPLADCQAQAYIVLISDGAPTRDESYNAKIRNELSVTSDDAHGSNYLPAVAKYMYENDLKATAAGKQKVVTYTIGFSSGAADAAPLLSATASVGGGSYYTALDSDALSESLTQIFAEILADNSSFTSPSVAASASDRTSTRDAVYYGMFLPSDSPRWRGNLKKLKINSDGVIVDAKGVAAIDAYGNIANTACSVWTKSATCLAQDNGGDGNEVEVGGVVEQLATQTTRVLKTIVGTAIQPLTKANLISGAGSDAQLRTNLGISESADLDGYVNWLLGIDVDDEDGDDSTSDARPSVFGDPLHSKPLAISYGEGDNEDVRILVGTNQGYLHMFKDNGSSVTESWALFLPELLGNVRELRENDVTGGHTVYGIDSSPVVYINDANYDGSIGTGDTAWVYFGMRRGGSSYYALDLTNPDNPKLKWSLTSGETGFENLGQTWSEPAVTRIPGYDDPVIIFAGGYDTSKDITEVGTLDNSGNSVYIVDAKTGDIVHRFEGTTTTGANTPLAATDSMPGKVALLDSDADGVTDRLYVTDTGANVWRIDMPTANRSEWSSNKFAELGDDDELIDDRRFFTEVSVAQTSFEHKYEIGTGDNKMVVGQEIPYDAVVVGSGNRSHPNAVGTNDYLFALQDRHINTQIWSTTNKFPDPIKASNLYSIDGDPFGTTNDLDDRLDEELELGESKGWFYSLAATEKALASPLIIAGKAYYTTYTPADLASSDSCVASGTGRLYGFDLQYGNHTVNMTIGSHVPDSPQLLVPPAASGAGDGWSPSLSLVGIGSGDNGSGTMDTGQKLVPTRIYYQYGGE